MINIIRTLIKNIVQKFLNKSRECKSTLHLGLEMGKIEGISVSVSNVCGQIAVQALTDKGMPLKLVFIRFN